MSMYRVTFRDGHTVDVTETTGSRAAVRAAWVRMMDGQDENPQLDAVHVGTVPSEIKITAEVTEIHKEWDGVEPTSVMCSAYHPDTNGTISGIPCEPLGLELRDFIDITIHKRSKETN